MGRIIRLRFHDQSGDLFSIRQRAGQTVEEFAELLSRALDQTIASGTLRVWEGGRAVPPPDVVEAAATITAAQSSGPIPEAIEPVPLHIVRGLAGDRITDQVANWTARQADLISKLDDQIGGAQMLPLAVENLDLATAFLDHGDHDRVTRSTLQRSVAELARLSGWLAVDAGLHDVARRYWGTALAAARESGDSEYAAHLLAYHALQASFQGDGLAAIDFLDAARQEAGRSASMALRALFDEWAINAWALVGDGRQAARHLRRADDLWERRHPEDDPKWLYWMVRPSENPEAGQAFLTLGQPRTAEKLLTAGMEALPQEYVRDRALYQMRIAEAQLAQRGRLDEAITSASDAAELVGGIHSPRAQEMMANFLRRLPQDEPAVSALDERMRERGR
ncbi:MAG: hypothetical protein DLM67_00975 [Candidatus Nephthysia bennettiae]|nr:MAG: hypothetical protein DLM67_00975 [Candidatus Dormibacteraeota bacterium]